MSNPKCFGSYGGSLCSLPIHSCSDMYRCIQKTYADRNRFRSEFRTFQRVFADLSEKCESVVQAMAELMINHPHIPSDVIGIPIGNIPPDTIHFSGFTINDENLVINFSGYQTDDSLASPIGGVCFPIEDIINDDQWHVKYIAEVTEDIEANIQEHELEMLKRLKEKYEDND